MEDNQDVAKVERRYSDEHFSWLIQYQIKKKSYNKISKIYNYDRKSIVEGIEKAANFIGLTLREPNKGGRPKTQ